VTVSRILHYDFWQFDHPIGATLKCAACSFGWWLMTGADLLWEKSTAGWLLVAGLFWEKSTDDWWLISQTNGAVKANEGLVLFQGLKLSVKCVLPSSAVEAHLSLDAPAAAVVLNTWTVLFVLFVE
jgi:hypothetical protein